MGTVSEAVDVLYEALATVDGVRPYRGTGVRLDPPASIVGPPRLSRGRYNTADPTEAVFQVAVVAAWSERAGDELMRLEPLVAAAIYEHTGAAVGDSTPGTWNAGGVDLPAYLIDVVFPL
jgi:hypothetical protein